MAQTFKSSIIVDNTVTATTFVGALSGNASTATAFSGTRTVTLTGDVTGSTTTWTGSGALSIATTIAANSVALGTDTTGNYVAGATAGQGIAITGTPGEGWSPTIALTALDLTLFPTSNFKKSVKVATTANITLSGTQTIDGIAVAAGDRVLVKDQTTSATNGIYIVSATAWARSTAADGSTEIDNAIVAVDQGTTNGGQYYTNTFKTTDVVGTTAMPWYRIPIDAPGYTYAFGISGNAATATSATSAATLTTARTINGTSFNGSANITTANWGTARSITLTGDVTGTVASVNGSANISIATTIAANSVALGTDTTGNYVGDITAGTGITIGGSAGEGTSRSIGLIAADLTLFPTSNFKKSVKAATTANITLSAAQTIDGIACAVGDRVLVKDQTTSAQNGIYIVAAGAWTRSTAADGSTEIDNAIVAVDQGTTNGGQYYTNMFKTTDVVGTTNMPWFRIPIDSSGYTYAFGVSGNAGSATILQTTRTINGVNFNGSANITITANTPQTLTRGTYLTGLNFNGGTATTWAVDATSANTASKVVARDASGNFSAGTITAALSGNATTATSAATLTTARTIALSGAATGTATSFNGSANITIPVTALNADNLSAGTVPDARLSGLYSGITLQTNGGNTHYTTPNTGSASTNDRTVFGLAQYKNDGSAAVGAIVFYAPNTNSTIMHRLRIEGMIYAGGPTMICIVQGYRTTAAWSNTSKVNLGIADIQVRFAVDAAGKNCLILGDVATTWSYPMMAITHAMFSHDGVTDAYCKDWTVGLVTDLSTFTQLTATIPNSNIVTGITGNASTATSAATLTTARTINGVSFNGSANITVEPYVERDDTTNATRYITFVDDSTAAHKRLNMDTNLTYNPSTNTLAASVFSGALSGNASTASSAATWTTGRTITLTGDVTGTSGAWNGSGNISFATTIAANSVALGTDTTGNYVGDVTAGTGIAIGGSAGEGTSRSIGLLAADLTLFPTSNFKKSVKAATTANITLSAPQTIDGIALVAGDRVLVKNQTTASQNGIYIVNAAAWTRSVAADGSNEIDNAIVAVDQGTANGGHYFTNTFKTTDVVGTTSMPWYKKVFENGGSWGISVTGSAATLTTARTINGTSFNGSANITTANWGTARTINGVSVNGSTNYTLEPYVERDDTTNATRYLTFVDDATAAHKRLNMDDTLNYNPSTGFLTATSFVGGLVGNANTATTLATARTINGTSFNGSANITTASWGTSRNLTIGAATKAVDGSANVSFTLAEIGISPGSASFPDLTNKDLGTGSYITSGDFRAPIFYDSTDALYYLHPNGFSNLSSGRFNSGLEVLGTLTYGAFSTGTNGYTRLPNGFIIQWARYTQTNDSTTTVSYPLAFPTAALVVVGSKGRTSTGVSTQTNAEAVSLNNASTFWANANDVGGTGYVLFIIAIGY